MSWRYHSMLIVRGYTVFFVIGSGNVEKIFTVDLLNDEGAFGHCGRTADCQSCDHALVGASGVVGGEKHVQPAPASGMIVASSVTVARIVAHTETIQYRTFWSVIIQLFSQ